MHPSSLSICSSAEEPNTMTTTKDLIISLRCSIFTGQPQKWKENPSNPQSHLHYSSIQGLDFFPLIHRLSLVNTFSNAVVPTTNSNLLSTELATCIAKTPEIGTRPRHLVHRPPLLPFSTRPTGNDFVRASLIMKI